MNKLINFATFFQLSMNVDSPALAINIEDVYWLNQRAKSWRKIEKIFLSVS